MFESHFKIVLFVIENMIYITLLGVGIYFIYEGDVVQRYHRQRTNFAVYEEPMAELPTIVTYVQLASNEQIELMEDFNIQYTREHLTPEKVVNLTNGENTIKDSNLIVFLHEIPAYWPTWSNHYKITPKKFNQGMPLEYKFQYQFHNVTKVSKSVTVVTIATENGSLSCSKRTPGLSMHLGVRRER